MAERIESFIDNDEEFTFVGKGSHPELSMYEEGNDDELLYVITLDDDDNVYCVWSMDEHEDNGEEEWFEPLDNDMAEYGTTYSMYYCYEKENWINI